MLVATGEMYGQPIGALIGLKDHQPVHHHHKRKERRCAPLGPAAQFHGAQEPAPVSGPPPNGSPIQQDGRCQQGAPDHRVIYGHVRQRGHQGNVEPHPGQCRQKVRLPALGLARVEHLHPQGARRHQEERDRHQRKQPHRNRRADGHEAERQAGEAPRHQQENRHRRREEQSGEACQSLQAHGVPEMLCEQVPEGEAVDIHRERRDEHGDHRVSADRGPTPHGEVGPIR